MLLSLEVLMKRVNGCCVITNDGRTVACFHKIVEANVVSFQTDHDKGCRTRQVFKKPGIWD